MDGTVPTARSSILDKFPGTPRPQQAEVLQLLEQVWDKYDVFVVRAPVATGKSRIAIALANWLAGSCAIITPTKILQQQYLDEFPELPTLWRMDSYYCKHCQTDCASAKRTRKYWCRFCPYPTAKKRAELSLVGVFNYWIYLTHRLFKDTLIVDEAHNVVPMLQQLAAKNIWKHEHKYPNNLRSLADVIEWLESAIAKKRDKKLVKLYNELLKSKPTMMIHYAKEEFRGRGECDVLKLVPIDTQDCPPLLWPQGKTNKVVLMSATLSETDLQMMGLHRRRYIVIDCESPIPAANRPIVVEPFINMAYRHQPTSLPLLAKRLEALLAEHQDKGVIHCTYALAAQLKNTLDNPRLMWHTKGDKKEVYEAFRAASKGEVLVASGLYEGIDLPYDLGRWQAICKVPYPSLAEPAIAAKQAADPDWYSWESLKIMLQGTGRICRTPDDYGITFILDACFMALPRKLMPPWFTQALVYRRRQ